MANGTLLPGQVALFSFRPVVQGMCDISNDQRSVAWIVYSSPFFCQSMGIGHEANRHQVLALCCRIKIMLPDNDWQENLRMLPKRGHFHKHCHCRHILDSIQDKVVFCTDMHGKVPTDAQCSFPNMLPSDVIGVDCDCLVQ